MVKVCGLIEAANALACAEAGADWIGLNFHPASPRSIPVRLGAEIARALQLQGRAEPVALFVNRPVAEVIATVRDLGAVSTIQLHGDESPEDLIRLQELAPTLRIIRAFRLSDSASIDRMLAYLDRADQLGCPPHAILVDAHVPGQMGGTGHAIAFDLLAHLPSHHRMILAGGLTPENVADRVALVRPWMVDVASGVESSPGRKDREKVIEFIAAVRGLKTDRKDGNGS